MPGAVRLGSGRRRRAASAPPGSAIQILVLLLLVITVAAILFATWQAQLRARAEEGHELERDIIRAAMMHGGRITALDVKPRRAVPVEAIEERLRSLHRLGHCESSLSDDGTHAYVFKNFDDAPQRAAAIEKRILLLAETHNGHVTARAVALATDLSYADSRRWLEHMAEQEICFRTDVPDHYTFDRPERAALPGEAPGRALGDGDGAVVPSPGRLTE